MDRIKVGEVGVDAGCIWIGDPCYIIHRSPDDTYKEFIGNNWPEFCEILDKNGYYDSDHLQFGGIGVVVSSGYGDGTYPVYIERAADGRVARAIIEFIEEDTDGS